MDRKYFTHVLLLLAMLVSQMATNAHMINHMADHVAVAVLDCDLSVHHSDSHHIEASKLESSSSDNSKPDNSKSDCSIFHAYAGANGIAPADRNDDDTLTNSVLFKQSLPTQIIAQSLSAHLIRGPPLYS